MAFGVLGVLVETCLLNYWSQDGFRTEHDKAAGLYLHGDTMETHY